MSESQDRDSTSTQNEMTYSSDRFSSRTDWKIDLGVVGDVRGDENMRPRDLCLTVFRIYGVWDALTRKR